ncbi:MAG: mismatch-specific DNA-glycosylase [Cycloclasticus sp. symbiont of Bathymodiolus heckerae]|nr:MAG: mismatch-specific DNA-glycosylase [Cycloclasticus sp. symbiont of Bathymodiolus heckerae]
MGTLPDLLNNKLRMLSVGLNPSLPSVEAGFYFANPRNRFWKALNTCSYLDEALTPSLESCHQLYSKYGIGFTDLVKRPTAGCKDLTASDYRAGSERLQSLINDLKPQLVWFHGKLTGQKYIQYSTDKKRPTSWGLQTWNINGHPVYITPNPSPANAAFSLQTNSDSYKELFKYIPKGRQC